MNCTTRLKIGEINKNFICVLCGGYYVDATTIIECLHSFCRTCIVTYLKTSKSCPVCDTIVHKTRPHQNIRSDKLLQDLVYKVVPGLYKDEMRRRREFYTAHYEAAPKRPGEERGDEMSDRFAYTEEENISLALHFCPEGAAERVDFRRVFTTKEDQKARMEKRFKEAVDVRYLQCKAAVTIRHLKKFIRLKYGLPAHFQIDMYYNDEPLRNSCTLCDVAFFFNWIRRAPLMLTFSVFEPTERESTEKKCLLTTSSQTPLKIKSEISAIPATTSTLQAENKTETLVAQPVLDTPSTMLPSVKDPSPAVLNLDTPNEITSKQQIISTVNAKSNDSNPKPLSLVSSPASSGANNQVVTAGKRATGSGKQLTGAGKRTCEPSAMSSGSSKRLCESDTLSSAQSKQLCGSSTISSDPVKQSNGSGNVSSGPINQKCLPSKISSGPIKKMCVSSNVLSGSIKQECGSNNVSSNPINQMCGSIPHSSDLNKQVSGCSTQPYGPSKQLSGSNAQPSGPCKAPQRNKGNSLGKRSASTPVPIAPAPDKIPALFGSSPTCIPNSAARDTEQKSREHNSSENSNLVSLLPVEMAQLSLTKAPVVKETGKPSSIITFSVSSILNAVSHKNSNPSTLINNKTQPVPNGAVALTATNSSPFLMSSSSSLAPQHHPVSTKQKLVGSAKTNYLEPIKSSRHPETPFSTSSSPCTSMLSVSSSPAQMNITQSSPAISVASPTPATSASPTPAAVPIQQSQTQGSDIVHQQPTSVTKKTEKSRITTNKDTNPTPKSNSDKSHFSSVMSETCDSKKNIAATINQSQSPRTERVAGALSKGKSQQTVSISSAASNSEIPSASSISVPSTSTSTVFMSHSIPDKIEPGLSPATSPTSNGPTSSGLITGHQKQTKQKKIADIANTLHKRMSDALLTMATKRAASPNNRKPPQPTLPTQKLFNSSPTHTDLREKAPTHTLNRSDLSSVKQSLQNVPPNGILLTNSSFPTNSQTDEPLNLVKRDQEIVRFTNGMFILDIPPSAT